MASNQFLRPFLDFVIPYVFFCLLLKFVVLLDKDLDFGVVSFLDWTPHQRFELLSLFLFLFLSILEILPQAHVLIKELGVFLMLAEILASVVPNSRRVAISEGHWNSRRVHVRIEP
jgi:hypothetical protein